MRKTFALNWICQHDGDGCMNRALISAHLLAAALHFDGHNLWDRLRLKIPFGENVRVTHFRDFQLQFVVVKFYCWNRNARIMCISADAVDAIPCVKHYLRPIAKLIVERGAYHKLMNECLHSSIALHIIEWNFRFAWNAQSHGDYASFILYLSGSFRELWFLNVECCMSCIRARMCYSQLKTDRIYYFWWCTRAPVVYFINSQYFGNGCAAVDQKWLVRALPSIFVSLIYWQKDGHLTSHDVSLSDATKVQPFKINWI